jgi:hypothetical protein
VTAEKPAYEAGEASTLHAFRCAACGKPGECDGQDEFMCAPCPDDDGEHVHFIDECWATGPAPLRPEGGEPRG